jgi:ubiquinone/menaquinone biosynthesis C-methylase UbiE
MTKEEETYADQIRQTWAGVFDRAAETYDRVGPSIFSRFGPRLVELARVPPGSRALDIACGRGAVLFPLASAVGPQGQAVGVDLSPIMVQETAQDAQRRGLGHVQVCVMDAERLDFPEVSFDAVLCGFSIFFFPHAEAALAEFHRVLKPGGRLAVTTWAEMDPRWVWFGDFIRAARPKEKTAPADTPAKPPLPVFNQPAGMQALLNRAGFDPVEVVSETADFVYASPDEWWATQWSHGVREALEGIKKDQGQAALERFKAAAFERVQTMVEPDGIHQAYTALFSLAGR